MPGRTIVRRVAAGNKTQLETAVNNLLATVGSGIIDADVAPNAGITLDKLKAVVVKGFVFQKANYRTAIPHRLGVVPRFVSFIVLTPTPAITNTIIQKCQEPDDLNVYLTCSQAGRKADILIVG